MGYKSFQIFVDSPTGSYYAGSNVTGRVVLVLEKPKKVRGLIIKFEGCAKVSWTDSESIRKNDGTTANELVTYSSEEEYFSIKYYLAGSANGEIEIPPGENVYPFQTTLPPRLPTSFDGEYGHVRYEIKATLDRPWKMDEEVKLLITVVTPMDLNFLPNVKEPVKKEASKTFCCLCCKSGPLTLAGSIPYSGYTPGQTIVATIEVDNNSNVRIAGVKCKLIKNLKWIAKSPGIKEKETKVELYKSDLDEVLPNGSKSWTQNVDIPHMPFINLDSCTIVNCSFYLEVIADPSGPHTSLVLNFPITLGTVPLYTGSGGIVEESSGPTPLYPSIPAINQSILPSPEIPVS